MGGEKWRKIVEEQITTPPPGAPSKAETKSHTKWQKRIHDRYGQ